MSGGVDKKYQAAREALKEADSKLRQFLSGKGKDNEECSNWITTEDENEDDDWITANNNKKVINSTHSTLYNPHTLSLACSTCTNML